MGNHSMGRSAGRESQGNVRDFHSVEECLCSITTNMLLLVVVVFVTFLGGEHIQ